MRRVLAVVAFAYCAGVFIEAFHTGARAGIVPAPVVFFVQTAKLFQVARRADDLPRLPRRGLAVQ